MPPGKQYQHLYTLENSNLGSKISKPHFNIGWWRTHYFRPSNSATLYISWRPENSPMLNLKPERIYYQHWNSSVKFCCEEKKTTFRLPKNFVWREWGGIYLKRNLHSKIKESAYHYVVPLHFSLFRGQLFALQL